MNKSNPVKPPRTNIIRKQALYQLTSCHSYLHKVPNKLLSDSLEVALKELKVIDHDDCDSPKSLRDHLNNRHVSFDQPTCYLIIRLLHCNMASINEPPASSNIECLLSIEASPSPSSDFTFIMDFIFFFSPIN